MDGQTKGSDPFDSLNRLAKSRAVGLYEEEQERLNALRPIYDYYSERRSTIANITAVSDFHIVEWHDRGPSHPHHFTVWLKVKRVLSSAETLDEALIIALCEKYGADTFTLPHYIARMIGMNKQNS